MEDHITRTAALGVELKKIRESKGLSLEDVSGHLKIQTGYLYAIETGKLDLLPSGFYRKSFIKEYCRYFGAVSLWEQYEELFAELERQKTAHQAEMLARQQVATENNLVRESEYKPINTKPLLISAGVILVIAITFIFAFKTAVRSGAKGDKVMQLSGGTEVIIEQKKEQERKQQQIAEEKAKKLSEERAKAEEATLAEYEKQLADTSKTDVAKDTPLAANELYVFAPTQEISIKAMQGEAIIFDGKIEKGKSIRLKVESELPLAVRYENPNKTDVTYAGKEFKPLHPSDKGRSRYYWSDGSITFTRNKQ